MSKSIWHTGDIISLLSVLDCEIDVSERGGDVDTDNLLLTARNAEDENHLFIRGFITSGSLSIPNHSEIDMIEVTDGQSSGGGLNTDDLPTCILYGQVCSLLRKAGHTVVPSLGAYF